MNDQHTPTGPEQLRLVPSDSDSPIQLNPEAPPLPLRYRLLTGRDDRDFCERISAALDEGYQLYGSPTLAYNGEYIVAAQAVIKEPEAPTGVTGLRPQETT